MFIGVTMKNYRLWLMCTGLLDWVLSLRLFISIKYKSLWGGGCSLSLRRNIKPSKNPVTSVAIYGYRVVSLWIQVLWGICTWNNLCRHQVCGCPAASRTTGRGTGGAAFECWRGSLGSLTLESWPPPSEGWPPSRTVVPQPEGCCTPCTHGETLSFERMFHRSRKWCLTRLTAVTF